MRWETLRTVEQKDRAAIQSLKSRLENCQKYAHKLSWNALYLARIGRPDTPRSVNQLARAVTKLDRSLRQTFSSFGLPTMLSCGQHGLALSIASFPRLRVCWWLWRFRINLTGNLTHFWKSKRLFLSVRCARNKRQHTTVLQNQKSFRWMLDCEWMDYLLLIYGLWWTKCYVHRTVPNHQPLPQRETVREITNPTPNKKGNRDVDQLSHVDHVTTNANSSQGQSQLYIFEDNEAVIKMIIKGRSPTMRHTELLLIGYSTESIWTPRSTSKMWTPKTNLRTC